MTGVLHAELTGLGRSLADLHRRVRVAVAAELARAVGDAVREVVRAVAAGRADPPRPASPRWYDERDDPWDPPDEPWADDGYHAGYDADDRRPVVPPRPDAAAAVAAGVFVARWWAGRRGSVRAAVGLGLGVGLVGVLGGTAARAAIAALAATGDLLGATETLGAAAARLAPD